MVKEEITVIRLKSALILFVVFALATGIYFYNQSSPKDIENETDNQQAEMFKIFELDEENINKIEINFIDNIVIEKEEDNFKITSHDISDIDSNKISEFKDNIVNLSSTRVLEKDISEVTLVDFGLDSPVASYSIYLSDNSSYKIDVGTINPSGDSQYVLSSKSNKIYLVPKSNVNTLLVDIVDFRDKRIVKIDRADLNNIKYTTLNKDTNEYNVVASLENNKNWKMNQPVEMNADVDAVNSFIEKMYQLEAIDFVPINILKELDRPIHFVNLLYEGDIEYGINVYQPKEEQSDFYFVEVKGKNDLYEISSDDLEFFSVETFDFVDKKLISQNINDLKEFTLNFEENDYKFEIKTLDDESKEIYLNNKLIEDLNIYAEVKQSLEDFEANDLTNIKPDDDSKYYFSIEYKNTNDESEKISFKEGQMSEYLVYKNDKSLNLSINKSQIDSIIEKVKSIIEINK